MFEISVNKMHRLTGRPVRTGILPFHFHKLVSTHVALRNGMQNGKDNSDRLSWFHRKMSFNFAIAYLG